MPLKMYVIFLFAVSLGSCSLLQSDQFDKGNLIDYIDFSVKVYGNDIERYPNGYHPWISIDTPFSQISDLAGVDINLPVKSAILYIDYPLSKGVICPIESPQGFTRNDLVKMISRKYHEIYDTEGKTSSMKVIPRKERRSESYRNETNGKYGICCNDISDLGLERIEINQRNDGVIVLTLKIKALSN